MPAPTPPPSPKSDPGTPPKTPVKAARKKDAARLPAFTPVPRKCQRHDGWTVARQRGFIAKLADYGSVRAAANAVGMTPESAYYLRRQAGAAEFRRAWRAALDLGIERIEDVAMERALNGVEVPVYAYGKIIGTRRVYNDRLLMFMLRNRAPRRFAADGASRMNAVDKAALARLKKQWRREWEAEAHAAQEAQDTDTLATLTARLDSIRSREEELQRLLLEDLREDDAGMAGADEDELTIPKAPDGWQEPAPKEDEGPRVRTVKDERWD